MAFDFIDWRSNYKICAWTESIAVGSKDFVGAIEEATGYGGFCESLRLGRSALGRRRFETEHLGSDAWALRESAWEHDALEAKKAARNSL